MPFRIPALLCSFLLLVQLHAQGPWRLHGVVHDATTDKALADAHIRLVGAGTGTVSAADGTFTLVVPDRKGQVLEVSSVGYATLRSAITDSVRTATAPLHLRLVRRTIELQGVTIERSKPEVVYQRSDLHVGDHFINDEGIWVLTYERPQLWHREAEAGRQVYREARLHLLDTNFVERCSIRLPTEVERLRHDHAQRTIVEGIGTAWSVEEEQGELVLQAMDLTTLHERVLPWTDSIQGLLLGSNHSLTYPAFDHFAVDGEGQYHAICSIEDERLMDLFRSQYKYMSGADKVIAMDLGLETGIDPEVIAGYMTEFYRDPYFDPPYAPLFVVRDTLCVFDQYRSRIRRFLPEGGVVDEVPMEHHRDRHWKSRLIQDPTDGAVYALYARNVTTWLRVVDTGTGQLGPVRTLDHPFPEDVQVHDGHAYYIYRPFGSLQHRTLYRQALD